MCGDTKYECYTYSVDDHGVNFF